jgi:hypothetical protein
MSKVVFLDIDGPMIPVKAYHLAKQTKPASIFDPCATAMLLKMLEESGAKIVISSTWGQLGKVKCKALLRKNGINPSYMHDDWITPRKFSSQRMHEIKWWLDDHPEVTHYVALDDEDLLTDFVPNAVLCDSQEGFSFRNYLESRVFLDIPKHGTTADEEYIVYCKRREVWRLARNGDDMKRELFAIADELFPVTGK